jgi:hypothetical protein
VATSSVRRIAQLSAVRRDPQFVPLPGLRREPVICPAIRVEALAAIRSGTGGALERCGM